MNNLFKIKGNPEQYEDLDVFHKLAQQFLPYAQQSLGFDKPVGVNLLSDPENVKDPLGKTAYYDPNKMEITLFVDKRHVKDILRSMAHELVHHTQNCRGEFDGEVNTGSGYAQDDEHMRKMEAEAYLKGSGFLLRDWEDSLKENKTMSKKRLKEVVNLLDPNDPGYKGRPAPMKAPTVDMSTPELGAEEFRVAMQQAGFSNQQIASVFGKLPSAPVTSGVEDLDIAGLADRLSGVVGKSQARKAADAIVPDDALRAATGGPPLEEGDKTSDSWEQAQKKDDKKQGGKKGDFFKRYNKKGDKTSDSWEQAKKKSREKEVHSEDVHSLEEGEGALCEMCGASGVHEDHCGKRDTMEEGDIPAGLKAYQDNKKVEGKDGKEKSPHAGKTGEEAHPGKTCDEAHGEEKSDLTDKKPDFLDLDGDGDKKEPMSQAANESWFKGNKDQLLFERLVEKWIK